MVHLDKAKQISKCLETAILFEVSANKPGNVNLVVGFEGTRVEHFLASAVAAAPSFQEAARRGIAIQEGKLPIGKACMGQLIRNCVADIADWQRGGNTLLGTVMLFIPLAVAAGMTAMNGKGEFHLKELRENIKLVVESSNALDAVCLYDAIAIAKPSGLNGAPDLSVSDPASKARLVEENVSLFKVFEIAAGYDDICFEWVNNFPITFDIGYPYLTEQLCSKSRSLNAAIIHTFLKVLAERPDTFISRKVGLEKARAISEDAKNILALGGAVTPKGRESLLLFDKKLREYGNNYNPGTTADITAATIALVLLNGYRG